MTNLQRETLHALAYGDGLNMGREIIRSVIRAAIAHLEELEDTLARLRKDTTADYWQQVRPHYTPGGPTT